MNQMMGGLGGFPQQQQMQQQHNQQLMQHNQNRHDPFGMMMSPFGGAFGGGMMGMHNSMMSPFGGLNGMMSMIQQQASSNAPGTFMQQQFVSYSSDGVNPPQVVERTHMNRVGPGGVREERKTLRDSRSGVQEMSIGRHINDRGHVMEKKKNRRTGEEEENQEFINIEEEEAEQFNNEFNSHMGPSGSRSGHHGNHLIQPQSSRAPVLAIAGPEDHYANYSVSSPRYVHSPSPAASTSSENGAPGSSRGHSKKASLRIKPISMKREKKSKKSTHLPKE